MDFEYIKYTKKPNEQNKHNYIINKRRNNGFFISLQEELAIFTIYIDF